MRTTSHASILALLAMAGCAAPGVQRGSTTTPHLTRAEGTTVVIADLARPEVTVGVVGPSALAMQGASAGTRRFDAIEREILSLYDRNGVADRVVAAVDMGSGGVPQPAFLVSYRLMSYNEHLDGPDARWYLGLAFGSITAGLGWLIAIDSRFNSTHSFQFEVRVFDVRSAPIVRASNGDGTFRSVYDTSIQGPILRRTYSGEMHSWIGAGTGGPGGVELDRFMDEQGAEVAQIIFDQSVSDVLGAVRRAAAEPVPMTTVTEMPVQVSNPPPVSLDRLMNTR